VTGYLVTTRDGEHFPLWLISGAYSNWLDCRPCRNDPARTTWHVMVADEDEHFIAAAQGAPGTTIERIDGAGDGERYELVAGEQGTGWQA
jgi:hypothetical protein